MRTALVLTASRSPRIGNGLTYSCGDFSVCPGMLVTVPLRDKDVEGIVIEVQTDDAPQPAYPLKPMTSIVGATPLLTAPHIQLLRWMAGYYWCSLRGALTPFLPASRWQALAKETPCDATADLISIAHPLPTLTTLQEEVYRSILSDKRPSLLFGITGSGKTEIYMHLIAEQMKRGKQTILLVPEILLTQESIRRFLLLLDRSHIALLHSRLTPAARRKEWIRIHKGEVSLIIGSRSALFAPCASLGLIIIDEEHEWTYKNEQTPRYHARDAAETLCRFAGAKLVLGSATPSLESWDHAKKEHYHLATLTERYLNRPLPTVRVIDLGTVAFGKSYPFSPPLLSAIRERLEHKEQSVLFLNRRGVASSVLCLDCRKRLVSSDTQLPYTMHHRSDGAPYLIDHLSGRTSDLPASCPHCGSKKLLPVGAGTQKIEELLRTLLPTARILRADSDTLTDPSQMHALLQTLQNGEADILLGTQSVVKGLDLPGVTLAAVLVADVGLSLPHFRAGERIMQLLTQLTGRSGRTIPGEVIIQTFRPQAPEIVAAATHDVRTYLDAEHALRLSLGYPPCTQMIRFVCRGDSPAKRAKELVAVLKERIASQHMDASVSAAPTYFSGGGLWHVLVRGQSIRPLLLDLPLEEISVDVDPMDVL